MGRIRAPSSSSSVATWGAAGCEAFLPQPMTKKEIKRKETYRITDTSRGESHQLGSLRGLVDRRSPILPHFGSGANFWFGDGLAQFLSSSAAKVMPATRSGRDKLGADDY